jgi:hypothetical protein
MPGLESTEKRQCYSNRLGLREYVLIFILLSTDLRKPANLSTLITL